MKQVCCLAKKKIDDAEQPDAIDCDDRIDSDQPNDIKRINLEQPDAIDCEGSAHVSDASVLVSNASEWPGFKILIDNLDKNLIASFQRSNNKTVSMHACLQHVCKFGSGRLFSSF